MKQYFFYPNPLPTEENPQKLFWKCTDNLTPQESAASLTQPSLNPHSYRIYEISDEKAEELEIRLGQILSSGMVQNMEIGNQFKTIGNFFSRLGGRYVAPPPTTSSPAAPAISSTPPAARELLTDADDNEPAPPTSHSSSTNSQSSLQDVSNSRNSAENSNDPSTPSEQAEQEKASSRKRKHAEVAQNITPPPEGSAVKYYLFSLSSSTITIKEIDEEEIESITSPLEEFIVYKMKASPGEPETTLHDRNWEVIGNAITPLNSEPAKSHYGVDSITEEYDPYVITIKSSKYKKVFSSFRRQLDSYFSIEKSHILNEQPPTKKARVDYDLSAVVTGTPLKGDGPIEAFRQLATDIRDFKILPCSHPYDIGMIYFIEDNKKTLLIGISGTFEKGAKTQEELDNFPEDYDGKFIDLLFDRLNDEYQFLNDITNHVDIIKLVMEVNITGHDQTYLDHSTGICKLQVNESTGTATLYGLKTDRQYNIRYEGDQYLCSEPKLAAEYNKIKTTKDITLIGEIHFAAAPQVYGLLMPQVSCGECQPRESEDHQYTTTHPREGSPLRTKSIFLPSSPQEANTPATRARLHSAGQPPDPRGSSQSAGQPPAPRSSSQSAGQPLDPRDSSQSAGQPPDPRRGSSQSAGQPPDPRDSSQSAEPPRGIPKHQI
ncbi:MAG: hypothetical protein K0S27_1699 [Gammaproteobacteria bacterium]|jgi:hypothetical protein|nr:hypothetical protein [Gammaproteobacteria bacterium]